MKIYFIAIITITAFSLSPALSQILSTPSPTPISIDLNNQALDNIYNRTPKEIWISADRTDGKGKGTQLDPLDAHTATLFTNILTTYQPNYTIHYGGGSGTVYQTYGWLGAANGRKTAGAGCKHFLNGTTIQLVGASNGVTDGTIFSSDYDTRSDGFEVHGPGKLDCNAANQPKWTGTSSPINAVNVLGSNILIDGVEIVNFGTKSGECFPIFSGPNISGTFENVIVENCYIHSPATGNSDGLSTITLGSTSPAVHRNFVVRNNIVDVTGNDFSYSHGPYADVIEGNYVKGCGNGFYSELYGTVGKVILRWNRYYNCTYGMYGASSVSGMSLGITAENNIFIDTTNTAAAFGGDDASVHYKEIVFKENRIVQSDNSVFSSSRAVFITDTVNATVLNNTIDNSNADAIHVEATASTVGENRTVAGTLLTYTFNNVSKLQNQQVSLDLSGSGTPEGVITAPVGATYHRTDGGAGTSFYVKESGTSNTGWVAK